MAGAGRRCEGNGKRVPGVSGDEAWCNAVRTKFRIKPSEIDRWD